MLRATRAAEERLEQVELDRATAAAVDDSRGEQPEFTQPQELAPQAEIPPAEPTELDRMLVEFPNTVVLRSWLRSTKWCPGLSIKLRPLIRKPFNKHRL